MANCSDTLLDYTTAAAGAFDSWAPAGGTLNAGAAITGSLQKYDAVLVLISATGAISGAATAVYADASGTTLAQIASVASVASGGSSVALSQGPGLSSPGIGLPIDTYMRWQVAGAAGSTVRVVIKGIQYQGRIA